MHGMVWYIKTCCFNYFISRFLNYNHNEFISCVNSDMLILSQLLLLLIYKALHLFTDFHLNISLLLSL